MIKHYCIKCGTAFETDDPDMVLCPQHRGNSDSKPAGQADGDAGSQHTLPQTPDPGQTVPQPGDTQLESISEPGAAQQTPSDWKTNDPILDTYEVKGELGKGGFGKVYRVHHKSWNIDLAVKRALILEEGNKQSFIDEAQHWIDLSLHPHIISCYYVRNIDGFPHTFAELAEGGSLHDWIQRDTYNLYDGSKEQALQRMLDIAIQFAWGLAYAHQQGLVHQDVKPRNALMTPEGILKVTDFGLAKARGAEQAQVTGGETPVKTVICSPYHCSPEQRAGEMLSLKTDIWSWAVSVLEMFNGGVTWMGGEVAASSLESYLGRAGDEQDIPAMPEALAELLRECFQQAPEDRPKDMLDIAERLKGIYQQKIGQAYPREMPKAAKLRADSLNNKALSLLDLGKDKEAVESWQEALKIDSHHAEATYNLGMWRWQAALQTDLEFVQQLEAVISIQAGAWMPNYLLGLVHLQRRDIPAARQALEEAERLSPRVEQVLTTSIRRLDEVSPIKFLHTLEGHKKWLTVAAITPDGRQVVSGSNDWTLRVWDLVSSKCLRVLKGHKDKVKAVAITPDGRWVVSCSNDKTLRVWDLASGECLNILEGHTSFVNAAAISPDGRQVVSGSHDKTLRVWDLESGKCLRTLEGHTRVVHTLAITQDGRQVVSVGSDKTLLWDLASGERMHTLKGHTDNVIAVAISPDGRQVVSGSGIILRMWDLKSGECLHTLEGHTNGVYAVAITPDGRQVVSGSRDKTLRVWDLASGKCLRTLKGHKDYVNIVTITPDGRQAVSGSWDKTLRVWALASGKCLRTLEGKSTVGAVAITPDGQHVISGSIEGDSTLRVWQLSGTNQKIVEWAISRPIGVQVVQAAAVTVQKKLEAAKLALRSGQVSEAAKELRQALRVPGYERDSAVLALWHAACRRAGRSSGLRMARIQSTLEGHTKSVNAVAITPDGRKVISGSSDLDISLRVWDLASGDCLHTLEGNTEGVKTVAITPDGRQVVTGGWEKTLRVWDLASGECLHTLEGHESYVYAVAITPDGRQVVSGGSDSTLRVWDLASCECLRTLKGHKFYVNAVAITPDGRQVVSGSDDKTLRVWDLASGKCLRTLKGHQGNVRAVAITPNGRYVVSGGYDKTLLVWNLENGECLHTLEGHTGEVNAIAIIPYGQQVVSGSRDKTLRIWDLTSGECLRTLKAHSGEVNADTISPYGRQAVSGSADKTLRVWDLEWNYEFPDPVDWDENAQPYMEIFVTLHTPIREGLFQKPRPAWSEADFQQFLVELGYRGYGWLREEGVRKKLAEMAARRR